MLNFFLRTCLACCLLLPVCTGWGQTSLSNAGSGFFAAADTSRPAAWAEPVYPSRNLYRLEPNLYRARQPEPEDIPLLQALNVKTVISFRAFHADEKTLSEAGIRLISIPIHTWDIRDDHVIDALSNIRQSLPRGGVLIHCQHGADRTGLISAMYRIVFQGWSRKEALRELTDGGYGYHPVWKNIPHYIRNVDIERIRRAVQDKTGQTAV